MEYLPFFDPPTTTPTPSAPPRGVLVSHSPALTSEDPHVDVDVDVNAAAADDDITYVLTDDPAASAIDLYLRQHPDQNGLPDQRIFAFNDDVVASSYYLSPMFRSFLLLSNTRWNRTEMITPGIFGTLNGSFVGLPRPTEIDTIATAPTPGRYRVVLRGAATANSIRVRSTDLDTAIDLRPSPGHTQFFAPDEVFDVEREAVPLPEGTTNDLEQTIGFELVPVNYGFEYFDLGIAELDAGEHRFSLSKYDANPLLVEGIMLVPEDIYDKPRLMDDVVFVSSVTDLRCSEKSQVRQHSTGNTDSAAGPVYEDLANDELIELAESQLPTVSLSGTSARQALAPLAPVALLLLISGAAMLWDARFRRPWPPPPLTEKEPSL